MDKVLTESIIPSLKGKIPKLYSDYGEATDGAPTQKFVSEQLQDIADEIGDINTLLAELDTGSGV